MRIKRVKDLTVKGEKKAVSKEGGILDFSIPDSPIGDHGDKGAISQVGFDNDVSTLFGGAMETRRFTKVYLNDPIYDYSVRKCIQDLKDAAMMAQRFKLEYGEELPVYLYIDSPGGSVVSGFVLVDFIESAPFKIITVGNGLVASMAAIILLAGKERWATKNSFFLIHQIRGQLPSGTYRAMAENLKLFTIGHEKFLKILVEKTSLDEETAKKYLDSELWIDAKEAKAINLIQKII